MIFDADVIIDGVSDPVLLLDPSGTIIHGNRQLRRVLRVDSHGIVGRSVLDLIAENSRENFSKYLHRCSGTTEPLPER